MSEPGAIPELSYFHPDGTPRTRIEMEQWLRSEVPKVHWLRIIANRIFHLPKQISWDMREIVLKHWLLDEMVRQRFIVGNILGINSNASNDDSELKQFTQKLTALIQSGQAVQPQHSEGIDMSSYTPPPPSIGIQPPSNGQPNTPPSFSSPPGPPMAPPVPQQYQQPPSPPMVGPPGYSAPPMGPPSSANVPAPTTPRRGRPPKDPSAAAQNTQVAPAVVQMPTPSPVVSQPPQQTIETPRYTVPVLPANIAGIAPPGFAPLPMPASTTQTLPITIPTAELIKFEQKLDQLLNINKQQTEDIASLKRKLEMTSMVATILARSIYQKEGSADAAVLLTELGSTVPQ